MRALPDDKPTPPPLWWTIKVIKDACVAAVIEKLGDVLGQARYVSYGIWMVLEAWYLAGYAVCRNGPYALRAFWNTVMTIGPRMLCWAGLLSFVIVFIGTNPILLNCLVALFGLGLVIALVYLWLVYCLPLVVADIRFETAMLMSNIRTTIRRRFNRVSQERQILFEQDRQKLVFDSLMRSTQLSTSLVYIVQEYAVEPLWQL